MKHSEKSKENKASFQQGLKAGIPIGMGYFAVSFTLGITARNAGLTPWQAMIMSLTMHASAGQFAAINVIAASAGFLEMAVTSLIVNLRYLLLSSSLSQKIGSKTAFFHRFPIAFYVTDEIFGISAACPGYVNPFYVYGAALVAAPSWEIGTFIGASVGNILPASIANAMNVALYGMFLAIIIPPAKKDKFIACLVVLSMTASLICSILPGIRAVSDGFRIIILTVIIAGVAAWLHPVERGSTNET
ncbi:MAG: AzlC family ABC transporter permease [Lachnospiraceae bacterium]|jgi:4-azaleucine resistance transporter AzlC|nr:AzlC family ABC transporter permease [Lachnospiraceae bacterium]